MSSENESWILKFVPFASTVESSFWIRYCHEKLDTIQLSEEAIPITASYDLSNPPRLQLQESSLQKDAHYKNEVVSISGNLLGFNTVETFQKADKNKLLRDWFAPKFQGSELNSFLLLTFADLKNHKILYWFAIPALSPAASILACEQEWWSESEAWSEEDRGTLRKNIDEMRCRLGTCPPFFVATRSGDCQPLSAEAFQSLSSKNEKELIFGFFDPAASSGRESDAKALPMGWPMRNLVAFLSIHLHLGGQTVRILSYRPQVLRRIYPNKPLLEPPSSQENDKSVLLSVMVPPKEACLFGEQQQYKVVGWELNARSKPGPRWVNLRPLLDERHLAVEAADLNLKLMKWRMIPSLNVEKLQSTKVLLIGAGTLGCSVARVLLGWGIRNFKIIDNGRVSYSNPVRQNLFTLDDCTDEGGGGGQFKAVAAAEALHKIAADVECEGVVLSIPMPGHVESDAETMTKTVTKMDEMVQDCDVVFLLTDTRESRWLPTVMAAAHDKVLINAALGLDSWLVMRHGAGLATPERLGCYFCNDVVAPENSMKNRTLDQQCTVTRPGLAPVASSMAAEMFVALLHHPSGSGAVPAANAVAAFTPTIAAQDDSESSPLGVIPHQIRGSLVSYTMMTPTVPAFTCCTACSSPVVKAYQDNKVELVERACASMDGAFLETLSGLTAFRADAASKMVDFEDWDEDE